MIYFESFKFKNNSLNRSVFGFSIKCKPKALNFFYCKNSETLDNLYESLWNKDLYFGGWFFNDLNLKDLDYDQKNDWFYENIALIQGDKFANKTYSLSWVIKNTLRLLNLKKISIKQTLEEFGLWEKRNLKISALNKLDELKFQLCMALIEDKHFILINHYYADKLIESEKTTFVDLLKMVANNYDKTILSFSTHEVIANLEDYDQSFLFDLDDIKHWKNNNVMTIYTYKRKYEGFKLTSKTFLGLFSFLWKNIWKLWFPICFLCLIFYALGLFLLIYKSEENRLIDIIFGYLLISVDAVAIAIITIISFFKLKKQINFLKLLNIKERYITTLLPVNIFFLSCFICFISFIFNLCLFKGSNGLIPEGNWYSTIYISTAFVIWSLVISVFVIVSFEKNYKILNFKNLFKEQKNAKKF